MVQPWLRRFTRAVEPPEPRSHLCFSQVPLRHGPRVFGEGLAGLLRALCTGQGADPPAPPAPQAAAAPPARHLADKFPLKEDVVVHNTCNPDTTLAPETPEWRWLADVTPKYVFRRAMTLWMRKHGQEDRDGSSPTPGRRSA